MPPIKEVSLVLLEFSVKLSINTYVWTSDGGNPSNLEIHIASIRMKTMNTHKKPKPKFVIDQSRRPKWVNPKVSDTNSIDSTLNLDSSSSVVDEVLTTIFPMGGVP